MHRQKYALRPCAEGRTAKELGQHYISCDGTYRGWDMPWEDKIEGTPEGFNVRHEWQSFDGNMPHCTLPFTGTRYTLIYHTNRSHYRMDGESWHFLEKELGFPMPPKDFHKPPYPKQLSRLSAGLDAFAIWREANRDDCGDMKVGAGTSTRTQLPTPLCCPVLFVVVQLECRRAHFCATSHSPCCSPLPAGGRATADEDRHGQQGHHLHGIRAGAQSP